MQKLTSTRTPDISTTATFVCLFSAASGQPSISTGKERDAESGNDYFGARYYASTMGRWLSPDWSSRPTAVPYADFSNPQSLNLYSYDTNNPLVRADKDGHCPVCVAVAVVIAGVAIYKGYKAFKELMKEVKDVQKQNVRLTGEILNPNSTTNEFGNLGTVTTPEERQAVADGGKAAVELDGAASAVQSLGDAAVSGAAESLTNPANAIDTVQESAHDSLQQSGTASLPDAPTPQPDSGQSPGSTNPQPGGTSNPPPPPPPSCSTSGGNCK